MTKLQQLKISILKHTWDWRLLEPNTNKHTCYTHTLPASFTPNTPVGNSNISPSSATPRHQLVAYCLSVRSLSISQGSTQSRRRPRPRRSGGVNYRNLKLVSRKAHVAKLQSYRPTKCALVNARLVMNKTFILQDFFTSHALDILFITETWISNSESAALTDLLPPDCTFLNAPRATGRGGGIATVLKNSLFCKSLPLRSVSSFWT